MKNARQPNQLSELATRPINEDLSFGIDVGVASCGWAVVDMKRKAIVMAGVRAFEEAKTAQSRRMSRGMRRNTKRRVQRIKAVRRLIRKHAIHTNPNPEALRARRGHILDPAQFSVEGLRRELNSFETASVLLYLAGHRGFQSNSKRDRKDTDSKKLLKELEANEQKLDGRTFSEMILAEHGKRRRNRKEEFLMTPKRDWLREEASRVIGFQRRLGAPWATPEFEAEYMGAAFDQRELRSSAHLIGYCNFEPKHRRASRFSYSYEKFRLLQALQDRCAIREPDGSIRQLTPGELKSAVSNIGSHRGMSYTRLKSLIGLDRDVQFIEAEDESSDIVTRGTAGCTPGCYAVRKHVGEAMWKRLTDTPALLDRAVAMIAYCEGIEETRCALNSLGIGKDDVAKLMDGVQGSKGVFDDFSGAGKISSQAARRLIPLMLDGYNYADACQQVGYNHARSPELDPDINSPAVKRALSEARKQIAVLVRKFGRPGHISVEMIRGKIMSSAQRDRDNLRNANRRKYRDTCRKEWIKESGIEKPSHGDVENYMLWKEQVGRCLFCDSAINMQFLRDNVFEVEHILPRSVSYDNSQSNRVLACTKCNREKRGRTPYQWFGHDANLWTAFEARVKNPNINEAKRKKLLTKDLADPSGFIARQLVDTGTVARRMLADVKRLYPEMYRDGQRIVDVKGQDRISAVSGRITGMLRTAWMRPTPYTKDREDDRHHALDAMVAAAISSESLPKILSETYKAAEERPDIRQRRTPDFPPPWPTFADDCLVTLDAGWHISRKENRRSRGALHEETIRHRRRPVDRNWTYMEWKSVERLEISDVKNILDQGVRVAVEQWLMIPDERRANGPTLPNGTVAKRVRVASRKLTARQVNAEAMGGHRESRQGGFVENAEMVRVDVYLYDLHGHDPSFNKIRSGYHLVPVYSHQISNKRLCPPVAAIARGKDEPDWPNLSPESFVFSLNRDDYVEFVKRDGVIVQGTYQGTNRYDAGIHVSDPYSGGAAAPKYGSTTIQPGSLRKFHVDRLGKLHEIKREHWPGSQPD